MENTFVTVLTFTYIHEVLTPRLLLESHGIECKTQDELTAQAAPFYSNAIGGIRLQVHQNDLQRAVGLLVEAGYLNERDLQAQKPIFDVDTFTSKFPLFKKRSFRIFIFMALILIIAAIGILVYYETKPSAFERLTKDDWCVVKVTYKNRNYIPQTIDRWRMSMYIECEESIAFNKNGTLSMPGFNSNMATGKWKLEGDLLHIFSMDTFAFVYNGIYELDFDKNLLELKSSNTTLNCHAVEVLSFPLF